MSTELSTKLPIEMFTELPIEMSTELTIKVLIDTVAQQLKKLFQCLAIFANIIE